MIIEEVDIADSYTKELVLVKFAKKKNLFSISPQKVRGQKGIFSTKPYEHTDQQIIAEDDRFRSIWTI